MSGISRWRGLSASSTRLLRSTWEFVITWLLFHAHASVIWFKQVINPVRNRRVRILESEVLRHKIVVVTGAGAGIGKAVAKSLVRASASVIAVVMTGEEPPEGVFNAVEIDLQSLAKTERAASLILELGISHIDVIVHCAGVMFPKEAQTEDGLETTLQVNAFAPYLFTKKLFSLLSRRSRVVLLSSAMHRALRIGRWDRKHILHKESRYQAYCLSKVAAHVLFNTIKGPGEVLCVHPGVVDSGLYRNVPWTIAGCAVHFLRKLTFWSVAESAREVIHQAILPSLQRNSRFCQKLYIDVVGNFESPLEPVIGKGQLRSDLVSYLESSLVDEGTFRKMKAL